MEQHQWGLQAATNRKRRLASPMVARYWPNLNRTQKRAKFVGLVYSYDTWLTPYLPKGCQQKKGTFLFCTVEENSKYLVAKKGRSFKMMKC